MRRWIPIVASSLCPTVIILAVQVLLAGYNNDNFEGMAIITYNTSALGLSDYYQIDSPLHSNVTALVPSTVTNPTSINRELGLKDWYSLHYLSTCSGFFQPSSTDPNVLTSKKVNSTCVKKTGYVFSISDVLRQELSPTVAGIADEATQTSYYTASWFVLWIIGIITASIEMFIFLPLTWHGTRRLNGWSALVSFISYLSFQIGCALAAGHSLRAYHNQTLPPTIYSTGFFAMVFTTMALMLVVVILTQLELRFELWTLKGEQITMYRKPATKSWLLMEAIYDRHPAKIDAVGRDEEYELH